MDFSEAEQRVLAKVQNDNSYVTYIAHLYYKERKFERVAGHLGIPEDFFCKLFSVRPEVEDKINREVAAIAEKDAERTNSLAIPDGLQIVSDIMSDPTITDKRILLQATALHLQFYLKRQERKNRIGDDELNALFDKMEKESNGGSK